MPEPENTDGWVVCTTTYVRTDHKVVRRGEKRSLDDPIVQANRAAFVPYGAPLPPDTHTREVRAA